MMVIRGIEIILDGKYLVTKGLKPLFNREFKLLIQLKTNDEYFKVLKYLINYVLDCNPTIKSEQTIAYHSWLLKFVEISDLYYEIWEANKDGINYVIGVDYSIKVINEQEEECRKAGVTPIFPIFDQKIAVSKGVYEGLAVDAVRYHLAEHMTGWFVTTDLYDDNVDSLVVDHYYHITFKRPDLIKYFALPYGYRFFITDLEQDIWYDQKIAEEER